MTMDAQKRAELWEAFRKSLAASQRTPEEIALDEEAIRRLEQKHREGYQRYPVQEGEFDFW